jgi:hypothetical protein
MWRLGLYFVLLPDRPVTSCRVRTQIDTLTKEGREVLLLYYL